MSRKVQVFNGVDYVEARVNGATNNRVTGYPIDPNKPGSYYFDHQLLRSCDGEPDSNDCSAINITFGVSGRSPAVLNFSKPVQSFRLELLGSSPEYATIYAGDKFTVEFYDDYNRKLAHRTFQGTYRNDPQVPQALRHLTPIDSYDVNWNGGFPLLNFNGKVSYIKFIYEPSRIRYSYDGIALPANDSVLNSSVGITISFVVTGEEQLVRDRRVAAERNRDEQSRQRNQLAQQSVESVREEAQRQADRNIQTFNQRILEQRRRNGTETLPPGAERRLTQDTLGNPVEIIVTAEQLKKERADQTLSAEADFLRSEYGSTGIFSRPNVTRAGFRDSNLFTRDQDNQIERIAITVTPALVQDRDYLNIEDGIFEAVANFPIAYFRQNELPFPWQTYNAPQDYEVTTKQSIGFAKPLSSITLNIDTNINPVGVITLFNKDNVQIASGQLMRGNVKYSYEALDNKTFNLQDKEIKRIELITEPGKIYLLSIPSVEIIRPITPPIQNNIVGYQNQSGTGGGNHTHGLRPNPHDHDITPDPHTHNITPNPHRHGMRFESGSLGNGAWFDRTRDCPLGPEILIKLLYDEMNTETAKEKSRVSEAAKKGNWIAANKIGKPVWDYLERYYIHRIICYLRAHLWYTEYETLSIVPTDLTIVPRELIVEYGGYVGGQGTTGRSTVSSPPAPPPPPPPTVYCVTPDDFNNPDVGNWTCKPYEAAEFSSTEICVFPGTIGFTQRCTEQDMYN